jgi:hypothetical protein
MPMFFGEFDRIRLQLNAKKLVLILPMFDLTILAMHLNAEVDIFTLFHKEVFDSSNRQPYI